MAIRDEIKNLYTNLLHRAADTAGLDYWENVISSGQASLADVQNLIANSAEAAANRAALEDFGKYTYGPDTTTGGTTTGGTTGTTTGGNIQLSTNVQPYGQYAPNVGYQGGDIYLANGRLINYGTGGNSTVVSLLGDGQASPDDIQKIRGLLDTSTDAGDRVILDTVRQFDTSGALSGLLGSTKAATESVKVSTSPVTEVTRNLTAVADADNVTDAVRGFYRDVLGREADDAGLKYFVDQIRSGNATLEAVRNAIATSDEAKGRGTTTTGGGGGAVTGGGGGAVTGGGGGAVTGGGGGAVTGGGRGMSYADAVALINSGYRSIFDRAPDQAGLDYWANLLTSGQQTWDQVLANIRRSAEAQTAQSQNAQAGIRQVPFGSQPVGGIVYPMTQMPSAASIPSFQQFSDPNAVANAFQQSLAYQAALPSMIQPFNPANIPATYQQIAAPRQRLDIANVQIPDWLRMAAARDEKRADAVTQSLLGTGTTGTTSGITTTTPGVIGTTGGTTTGVTTGGTTGGTTGIRSAADLQAFQTGLSGLYQNAFNRSVDTAGGNYWTNLYNTGTSYDAIANAIMNSSEAQARSSGGLLGGISE
jgi:hypothetical protein